MTLSKKFISVLFLLAVSSSTCSVFAPRVAVGISSKPNTASNHGTTTPRNKKRGLLLEIKRGGAVGTAKIMTSRQFQAFNLLSGGVAGTIAAIFTNPLEVVKTQLQASSTSLAAHGEMAVARGHPMTIANRILETDGLSGFFRGLPPTIVGILPSRSAYFFTYQQCKERLAPIMPEGSSGNALVSGLMAGIAGNTLTNPIWMVRTRMQVLADAGAGQKLYTGYRDVITTIAREEGIAGFYKGICASYWGCIEGSIQFMIYEKVKAKRLLRVNTIRANEGLPPTDHLTKIEYLGSAAMAKCVASIATYPHEVARTRLREQARDGVFKYHGMWQAIGLIAKEEGRSGIYAGMGVHLMKVVPNSAIMFLTYELVNRWLGDFTVIDSKKKMS